MCGKFTQMLTWSALVELADFIPLAESPEGEGGVTQAGRGEETITPMRFADVIARDEKGKRRNLRMRWGMVPPGAKDPIAVKQHIHARAETIDVKPTFREAFAERRGLLLVKTFNEGREVTPSKTEQLVLSPLDGAPIAIAVIYEKWQHRDGASLLSFAMVTVPPSPLIATITDRMPALIAPEDFPLWLGEAGASLAEVKALLKTSDRALAMQKEARRPPPPKPQQPDLF